MKFTNATYLNRNSGVAPVRRACCFRFSRGPYRLSELSAGIRALPALNRSSHLARDEEFTVLILVLEWSVRHILNANLDPR